MAAALFLFVKIVEIGLDFMGHFLYTVNKGSKYMLFWAACCESWLKHGLNVCKKFPAQVLTEKGHPFSEV